MAEILIVDDDYDLVDVLLELLRDEGHTVSSVPNGLAALHVLGRRPPDLMILDMMMPMMAGPEVLDQLRAMRARGRIPCVVVITAMPDLVPTGPDVVHHAVLRKPLNADHLLATIRRLLSP